MSDIVNVLVEMGFSRDRAELATSSTNGQGVEEAMEWILSNEELEAPPTDTVAASVPIEDVEEKANTEPQEKEQLQENQQPQETEQELENDESHEAKSIKCDDCGKLFRTSTEVEFHAAKSGHSNFSESTEEKKPLTEEEKKEQLAKIEAKLKQRRLEREAREKQEELEREKTRIRSGKDLLEAKRKQEETEIKKVIEQRKREKQEEKLARERVKQQIEQDRQARKAMFGEKPDLEAKQSSATPVAAISPPPPATKLAVVQNYSEVKLQIRLTNGAALTQTFGAKEPLSAVRVYVEINRTDEPGPFLLRTAYPNKVFAMDDYDKPLELLGLAPSAVLFVSKT